MADHGDAERQAHWLVPSYLAAHGCPNATLASYDDLGLTSVIETSTRCSDFRGHARHLALPMPPMALSDNPWREVFGLAGSIGESLAIAAACEVEVDLHRKARACGDLPPEMIVGQRFFSIAEGHEVLGIGHRLANLVLRGVAIGEGMRDGISAQGKLFQAWAKSHKPFSDARAAWVSFNRSTVDCLTRVVASSPHPALRDLAGALAALHQSAVWMAIDDSRGQDFHRWRAESSVLAGVDQQSGYFREICEPDGTVIGHRFCVEAVRYTRADGLEEGAAQIARSALLAVAEATNKILDALELAAEPLSRGHIMFIGGKPSARFGHRWSELSCRCCTSASG